MDEAMTPKNYNEALTNKKWRAAMIKELSCIQQRGVWKAVNTKDVGNGSRILSTRWLYSIKNDGTCKARLVAMGCFQRPGIDYWETFSPVVSDPVIRMTLCVANHRNWDIQQIDVETAFLNAELKEDVYIRVPKGMKDLQIHTHIQDSSHVLKLNKALYGLVQAPRAWMKEMNKTILKLGFVNCRTDPCLSILKLEGEVKVVLLVYVDDCIIAGETQLVQKIIKQIEEIYKIKILGPIRRYLGYEVKRNKQVSNVKIAWIKTLKYKTSTPPGFPGGGSK